MKRLVLVDIFKILIGFFLVFFHTGNKLLNNPEVAPSDYFLYPEMHLLSHHFFYYSGLYIVAISFFLLGFFEKKIKFKLFIILFIGQFFAQASSVDDPQSISDYFDWGVFSFLLIAVLFIYFVEKLKWKYRQILLVLPTMLVFIPQYIYSSAFDSLHDRILRQMLFGDYEDGVTTGWYLFPWIFYPTLFYFLGKFFLKMDYKFKKINLLDFVLVGMLILAIYIEVNLNLDYKVSPRFFNKNIFSLELFQILPTVVFPLFILRLSLLDIFNRKIKFLEWKIINGWSHSFWVTYWFHLLFIAFISKFNFSGFFSKNPNLAFITLFIYFYSSLHAYFFNEATIFWKTKFPFLKKYFGF